MYLPDHFHAPSQAAIDELVAQYPLASLVTSGSVAQPWVADPVPLLADGAVVAGGLLLGHVARANPLWQSEDRQAMAIFTGPRAYITPNAYPSKTLHHRVVPTYNYAVVQVTGELVIHDDPEIKQQIVQRLTQTFERDQPEPWSLSDAPQDYIDAMLQAIVGFELRILEVQAKWKVSQNRTLSDQMGVQAELAQDTERADGVKMAQIIDQQLQAIDPIKHPT
jgi:transcriptional regulator